MVDVGDDREVPNILAAGGILCSRITDTPSKRAGSPPYPRLGLNRLSDAARLDLQLNCRAEFPADGRRLALA